MKAIDENNIALLIDGDNAQVKLFQSIFAEAYKFGKITIRRVYGDFTDENLKGWENT